MSGPRIAAGWLAEPGLQALLAALSADGEEARVAGGAIRNTLLGEPAGDVDIATTTPPQETTRRAEAAGFRAVPTGIEHGTVTVVIDGCGYEVTTLRADVETDGRRAKVRFGRDWKTDAERRDFTINALYARADGTVIDLVGGLADLEARRLRFIGDAEARIREDYLRILRFFRFFAWYGSGRPDAEGLKACARLKEGLDGLSAERVWSELSKLLSAPDPGRALLWMRQAGVLTRVLPESEKWGIDLIPALVAAEREAGRSPDALLRLMAIVPPDEARLKQMAERLRMSGTERERLAAWARTPAPVPHKDEAALARTLYGVDSRAFADRLRLGIAAAHARQAEQEAGDLARQLRFAESWSRPAMPLQGRDLLAAGIAPGPQLGTTLKRLEEAWVASGFTLDRAALLERATADITRH